MKDVQIVYPSTATTADHTVHFNTRSKGGIFIFHATAETATASVVFTIKGVDPAGNTTWDILASAAFDAVGTRVLRVYPGLTAVTNLTATDILPEAIQIFCDHNDADSFTYSITFIGVD